MNTTVVLPFKRPMTDKLLTLAQAAEQVNRDASTLRHAIHDGKLKAQKFGNSWVVTEADLKAWVDNLAKVGRPPKTGS